MKQKVAKVSIFISFILAAGKIIVGIISGSAAVLADGFHSFTDILSSAISYIGVKISEKPGDDRHPYGHHKFEVLAGAIITIILFLTGLGIIFESYRSFINPKSVSIGYVTFAVIVLSVLVSGVMARVKLHFGKKENSIALLSDGMHSRMDMYTSLAVLVGLFAMKYWPYADSLLAFFVGIYIVKESFNIGKEAVDSLLDSSAGEDVEKRIREIVSSENITLNDLKTQKKGSVITVSVEINLPGNLNVKEATEVSQKLRKKLTGKINNLSYVSIQIKSHYLSTGFYKPQFGKSIGWQKSGGAGPGGECVCGDCGYITEHKKGSPCHELRCPRCNIPLKRD